MANSTGSDLVRTLVVFETSTERHVYELAAEGNETYENPDYYPEHRLGPLRLSLQGRVLQHVVYPRTAGDNLVPEQSKVEQTKRQIERDRERLSKEKP